MLIEDYLLISALRIRKIWLPGSGSAKNGDPRIQIQGVKYQPKTVKKTFLLLKPKSELLKHGKL